MKLKTASFGDLDIKEDDIYSFPQGIPGFEQMRKYVLINTDQQTPFCYLQSVDNPNLAFILIDPFDFFPDYEFDLSDAIVEDVVQIGQEKDIIVRTIISIADDLGDATANLVAPVILNVPKRIGKQVVLTQVNYSTKHRLFKQ